MTSLVIVTVIDDESDSDCVGKISGVLLPFDKVGVRVCVDGLEYVAVTSGVGGGGSVSVEESEFTLVTVFESAKVIVLTLRVSVRSKISL